MTDSTTERTPYIGVLVAFLFPVVGGLLFAFGFGNQFLGVEAFNGITTAFFLGVAAVTIFIGRRRLGWSGLGFRGGRPMFAGLGFAFLGWVVSLIARFVSIGLGSVGSGLGVIFLYLFIIEGICLHVWCFGLLFYELSQWRNPLTAALMSGLVFGFFAQIFFREALPDQRIGIVYFMALGVMYGIIRLRTGSWFGIALIQALQSLTLWHLITPSEPIQLGYFYGIAVLGYIIITWRLLPKQESDFRV